MALLWIIKAINLLVILPSKELGEFFRVYVLTSLVLISWLKPKPSNATTLQPRELAQELQFDRYLAQASLLLDGTSDLLVALTSARSQVIFIALSCVSSFTSGAGPALHSLGAVCLHACGHSSEIGVLFGAKAVLSAVAHIFSVGLLSQNQLFLTNPPLSPSSFPLSMPRLWHISHRPFSFLRRH